MARLARQPITVLERGAHIMYGSNDVVNPGFTNATCNSHRSLVLRNNLWKNDTRRSITLRTAPQARRHLCVFVSPPRHLVETAAANRRVWRGGTGIRAIRISVRFPRTITASAIGFERSYHWLGHAGTVGMQRAPYRLANNILDTAFSTRSSGVSVGQTSPSRDRRG